MDYNLEPACKRMEWLDPFFRSVWEKAYAEVIPISGTFELTPRCNFNCRMCYVHLKESEIPKYGKEFTANEWIYIADEAKKAGTTWICITGGEPLMHPEFETIWTELSQMGFFITLQTNGFLVSKYQNLFEQYPPRAVKITLYGSCNKIYEAVCRIKDGFTHVDSGIQILRRLRIPVRLVSTIVKNNEMDFQEMAMYAYKNRLLWVPSKDVRPAVRINNDKIFEQRLKISAEGKEREQIFESRMKQNRNYTQYPPCAYCKDYKLGYWITWDGYMRFCSLMNKPDICVRQYGFQKSWEKLIEYQTNLKWPDKCYTCKANTICFKCAGVLNAECGDPERVTDDFCQQYISYVNERRK